MREKLDWLTRIGFMFCAMPELLKSFVWDAFILFYYSQVIGLQPGLIGMALLIILIFDAAVDPYIGALSDRLHRAPLGRRHTLMAAAIIPFVAGLMLVFSPPAGLDQSGLFGWLLGFGLLARVGISFWTVPAYALGGELTRDAQERSIIAVMRNLGNQVAILFVPWAAFAFFFIPTAEFSRPQLNPAPYPMFGIFVGILGAVLMITGIAGTRRRIRMLEQSDIRSKAPQKIEGPVAVIRHFIAAIRITPNIGRLMIVGLLVLFTTSVINQLTLHLATYFWRLDTAATSRLLMAGTFGALVAMAAAPAFMKRLGTRRAMISGLTAYFIIQALVILLPLLGLAPLPATAAIGFFVFGGRVLGGLFYGLYVVPFNTVTYDIGDEHEANTGTPQQGLVSSFMFLGLQIGSGLVSLLSGLFLQIIDFPVGQAVEAIPDTKIRALAWFVLTLILVSGVAMSLLVGGFHISAEKQQAIRERLAQLRG